MIPKSHLWPLPCPKLDDEDRATRHSTLSGLGAGGAVIRDLRLWHAGTPNVSNQVHDFVQKTTTFALKTMNFALKTMDLYYK